MRKQRDDDVFVPCWRDDSRLPNAQHIHHSRQVRFLHARKPMTYSSTSLTLFVQIHSAQHLCFKNLLRPFQKHRFSVYGKLLCSSWRQGHRASFSLQDSFQPDKKKRTKMRPICETSETGTRVLRSKFKKFKRE